MFAKRHRLLADRRGTSAVEFALIAPLFLLLAIGAMEVSIAMHKGASVQWAIEKAARTAMLNPATTQTSLQALVDANLAEMGVDAEVDVTYSAALGGDVMLGRATATYTHTVRPLFLPEFDMSFDTDVTFPQAT